MKRNAKIAIALPVGCVAAIALFFVGSVGMAESTEIGSYGRRGPLMHNLESASDLRVPHFTIDCDVDDFVKSGWWSKVVKSIDVNYWAMKARSSENAFAGYDNLGQEKLAALAATDAIEYWSGVAYAQKELECYEVASIKGRGSLSGHRAQLAAEADAREAAAQEAADAKAIQAEAAASQEAANAAAAAADAAAAAADAAAAAVD